MKPFAHALRTAATSAGLLSTFAALPLAAQVAVAPLPPDAPMPPARAIYFNGQDVADRGYLGITPSASGGPADTLGLLIDDVEDGLPADKAGIKRGARLVSIDDVDLRVEPRDLGDYAAEAVPENRLRRVLGRKKAGDTVTLVVLTDGRKDTRRVVLAESPMAATMRSISRGRRVLGVSFSERGSMRDTAGLLIVTISSGGAADKAGLMEGDRVVSVDGVDLRVPASDAGTSDGVQARVSRFRRALDASRDSQPVKLEVLSEGRRRTVNVIPQRERGFSFTTGDMRLSGLSGLRNLAEDLRVNIETNGDDDDMQRDLARVRIEAQREAGRAMAEGQREAARARIEVQRELARARRDAMRDRADYDDSDLDVDRGRSSAGTMRGRTDGATLTIGGLTLATVDRDFAQQFGRGSENGALIVRVRGDWDPLKAGDVLLTIEGRSVRDGSRLDVSVDRRRDQRVEILRNGKKETLTLPSTR